MAIWIECHSWLSLDKCNKFLTQTVNPVSSPPSSKRVAYHFYGFIWIFICVFITCSKQVAKKRKQFVYSITFVLWPSCGTDPHQSLCLHLNWIELIKFAARVNFQVYFFSFIAKWEEFKMLKGKKLLTNQNFDVIQDKSVQLYPKCDCSVWLRSCEQEILKPIYGKVSGEIPKWLSGNLLRNGPGSLKVGNTRYQHLFDSAALLHR